MTISPLAKKKKQKTKKLSFLLGGVMIGNRIARAHTPWRGGWPNPDEQNTPLKTFWMTFGP